MVLLASGMIARKVLVWGIYSDHPRTRVCWAHVEADRDGASVGNQAQLHAQAGSDLPNRRSRSLIAHMREGAGL